MKKILELIPILIFVAYSLHCIFSLAPRTTIAEMNEKNQEIPLRMLELVDQLEAQIQQKNEINVEIYSHIVRDYCTMLTIKMKDKHPDICYELLYLKRFLETRDSFAAGVYRIPLEPNYPFRLTTSKILAFLSSLRRYQ